MELQDLLLLVIVVKLSSLVRCDSDLKDNFSSALAVDSNNFTCSAGQFSCFTSGVCLPWRWTCDSEPDCSDGSDESDSVCSERLCDSEEWSCHTEKQCVPLSWVCDNHKDCSDGSDETVCTTTCLPGEKFFDKLTGILMKMLHPPR